MSYFSKNPIHVILKNSYEALIGGRSKWCLAHFEGKWILFIPICPLFHISTQVAHTVYLYSIFGKKTCSDWTLHIDWGWVKSAKPESKWILITKYDLFLGITSGDFGIGSMLYVSMEETWISRVLGVISWFRSVSDPGDFAICKFWTKMLSKLLKGV